MSETTVQYWDAAFRKNSGVSLGNTQAHEYADYFQKLETFAADFQDAESILDIGPGFGHFLAKHESKERYAIEVSPVGRKKIEALGVTVFAPKKVEEEIVDIVTCLSVVQHCSKDEVEVIFKDAAKALKDGGTFYVNGVDTGFDNDAAEKSFLRRRSRFSYSPQEIEALAKKNKLTVSKKMVYRLGRMNVWIFRLKK